MTLEVIGAGLGRTGTLSLKAALEQLGFRPCFHMIEVLVAPERAHGWLASTCDWDATFAGYRATVDWPGAENTRQLWASRSSGVFGVPCRSR